MEHPGLQPAAVVRQARLPATLHLSAGQLVVTAQFFAIWKALGDLSGDPAIGIKFVAASDAEGHQPLFPAACYAVNYRGPVVDRRGTARRLRAVAAFADRLT